MVRRKIDGEKLGGGRYDERVAELASNNQSAF